MVTNIQPFSLRTMYSVIVGAFLGQLVVLTVAGVAAENMTTPCRNIQVETSRESVEVTWPLPVFNVTSEGVIGRCDRDPGSRFFWGTVWVRCWAEGHTGSQAECHFTVTVRPSKCPMWSPPKNGALACDRWLFGQFCMVFCYQEFEFDSQPAQLYICGASGLWSTTSTKTSVRWPNCLELRSYKMQHRGIEQQYFADDVLTEEQNATRSVQQNFLDVFEGTAFGEQGGCTDNSDCRPENVAVFWGDSVEVTPPPTTTSIVTSTQMVQTNTTYVYDAGPELLTIKERLVVIVSGLAGVLLLFGACCIPYCRKRRRRNHEPKPTGQELKVMLP